MAQAHAVEAAPILADAAGLFRAPLQEQLECFAQLIQPHLGQLDASFRSRLKSLSGGRAYNSLELKALFLISSGAVARIVSSGRPLASFFEQVSYNSRRLAKMNVPPADVADALREYDGILDALLANRYPKQAASIRPAWEQLHFGSVLTINNAFYQVREAETQAFFGLLRAEMEASGLDDLLRRFITILTRTFRAQAGRLIPLNGETEIPGRLLKRLARSRYIPAGSSDEELILDAGMRGKHQSYWSIPFFLERRLAGLVQFGFPTSYRWLPRELDLLDAFAERCLQAAERTRLQQELAAREEQVRGLAAHLMQAEEEERRRISRELHDEAGQAMLFLRLHLEMLEKIAPADLQPKVAEARTVASRIILDIRRIIGALSPSVLEQLGLTAAIRQLSARFRKLYPMKLHIRLGRCHNRLAPEVETTLYRIVQECYQNIAKHAGASRVNLWLEAADQLLELKVEDDGRGFDVGPALAKPESFGLKGMRERIVLLGGGLEIRSAPGGGTSISVRLPISVQPVVRAPDKTCRKSERF